MTPRVFIATLLSIVLGLAQDPVPQKLNIVIVEGEGAINNIRQRVAREPIVQVEDENRKPVAGASVVFLLPSQGASGTFTGGAKMLTVMTDQNGRAVMRGFTPNNVTGKMEIRVTASKSGVQQSAVISQTNAALAATGAAAGSGKLIAILVAVGGAAAAGVAVAATRGGNNTPTPGGGTTGPTTTPTVISPGNPTVGPPR
ncbi:MAG: hypothetical protein JST93_34285 [Acidobacteria bacterium]|nr:hypothetical protein [Acidobacteriota bacterium]